jgi:hypothetical protein
MSDADRQLAPAADGILHFLDTSFEAVAGGQAALFRRRSSRHPRCGSGHGGEAEVGKVRSRPWPLPQRGATEGGAGVG